MGNYVSINRHSILDEVSARIERASNSLKSTRSGSEQWVKLSAHHNALVEIKRAIMNNPKDMMFVACPSRTAIDVDERLGILANEAMNCKSYRPLVLQEKKEKKRVFMYDNYIAYYLFEVASIASELRVGIENEIFPVMGSKDPDDWYYCKMF